MAGLGVLWVDCECYGRIGIAMGVLWVNCESYGWTGSAIGVLWVNCECYGWIGSAVNPNGKTGIRNRRFRSTSVMPL